MPMLIVLSSQHCHCES